MVSETSSSTGRDARIPNSDRYFAFSRADCDTRREAAYRIRYQVYCVERAFLDRADYPDGLERDAFDAHAIHILATHKSGEPAGTARLVMHSQKGFPLRQHCRLEPDHARCMDDPAIDLGRYAEVSRLAVAKAFRQREGDTLYGGPPRPSDNKPAPTEVVAFPTPRETPEIVSGLYRTLYQESRRRGIEHWLVAMERGLQVILNRAGFRFEPIGPLVDYFGPVRPYMASLERFERHLFNTAPAVLRFMLLGLERDLWPDYARDEGGLWAQQASRA